VLDLHSETGCSGHQPGAQQAVLVHQIVEAQEL